MGVTAWLEFGVLLPFHTDGALLALCHVIDWLAR